MKKLAVILLTACICSSCTIDHTYVPKNNSLEEGQVSTEDLYLLWPQTTKVSVLLSRDMKPRLNEVATPNGFNISPAEIVKAMLPMNYRISIYADPNYYYVVSGAAKRKPELVRDYGFKIDGRTGQPFLPASEEPSKMSIPDPNLKYSSVRLKLESKYSNN